MFKKANVVMLPTNDKAVLNTHQSNLAKHLGKENYLTYNEIGLGNISHTGYNLYITSDEKIKEGDWFIFGHVNDLNPLLIEYNDYSNGRYYDEKGRAYIEELCTKVIASTDYSIMMYYNGNDYKHLPQPSPQFIAKFIEEYNKGNIITEVMVEYNEFNHNLHSNGHWIEEILKVNSKDNTITIKKIKDSYTREEVENLLFSLAENYAMTSTKSEIEDFNNWIKQNL